MKDYGTSSRIYRDIIEVQRSKDIDTDRFFNEMQSNILRCVMLTFANNKKSSNRHLTINERTKIYRSHRTTTKCITDDWVLTSSDGLVAQSYSTGAIVHWLRTYKSYTFLEATREMWQQHCTSRWCPTLLPWTRRAGLRWDRAAE